MPKEKILFNYEHGFEFSDSHSKEIKTHILCASYLNLSKEAKKISLKCVHLGPYIAILIDVMTSDLSEVLPKKHTFFVSFFFFVVPLDKMLRWWKSTV